MDSDVATAVTTALTSFKTDALSNFATVIPIAFGLLVTVAVVYFLVKHFRSLTHI